MGRRVVYCDLGIKVRVEHTGPKNGDNGTLHFQLGLPFTVQEQPEDLTSLFYGEGAKAMANMVFGNVADAPKSSANGNVYDDGEDLITFTETDPDNSKLNPALKSDPYCIYQVRSKRPVVAGEICYFRLRFKVSDPGRTWSWQKIGMRRSFAITDLRVNEFREIPPIASPPDFQRIALNIDRINCFFVASSKFKAGRISPAPRYVRVLERTSWEKYLKRKLTLSKNEVFVITYWRKDGDSALEQDSSEQKTQFRAFLELERRRPTAARFALIASAISIVGFLLLTPTMNFQTTFGWSIILNVQALLPGILGAGFLAAAVRFLPMLLKSWKWFLQKILAFEAHRYKL
jgi:hypothetical protein